MSPEIRADSGPRVTYSTFLGGSVNDHASAIATDQGQHLHHRLTLSYDFPVTSGAYQHIRKDQHPRNADCFVAKFDPGGNLLYSTYLGGLGDDRASAIAKPPQNAEGAISQHFVGWRNHQTRACGPL